MRRTLYEPRTLRSFTNKGQPGRCQRCWILDAFCVCGTMPTVSTRTEVLVVRHERESWKSTGTARIAALAMPNLRILDFRENSEPARTELPALVGAGTHLLFPTEESAPWDGTGVTRLVVLDGTWRQVRRMYAKLPALHAVPKLALPEKVTKVLRLRDSKFEAGRSTLEAIAEAVALLEGEPVAAPLHALHALYVERVFRARGVWEQKNAPPA
ncbi:MAG: tRNA-uridine aminocarboxypropyltransferase [Archangium sp.]|nr:tRNA-uridine aminocarboxypropyltransferase [Archangium sp.]